MLTENDGVNKIVKMKNNKAIDLLVFLYISSEELCMNLSNDAVFFKFSFFKMLERCTSTVRADKKVDWQFL